MTEEQKSLQWLSAILDILRRQCPWDSVQTVDSLRYLTIEEVYELSEAVVAGDWDEMRKELGDLFMHLLFYAKIAEDEGHFTTSDVLDGICRKLISRHPHIALPDRDGQLHPATASETPRWEQVKMREGRHSVLEGVPASLPSLVKAIRLHEKAAGTGFQFATVEGAQDKVIEEYNEFVEALKEADASANPTDSDAKRQHAEEELGDLLFAIIKWGNMLGYNADTALMRANNKFITRYSHVEECAAASGRNVQDLTLDEMVALWNEAKQKKPSEN